MFIKKKLIVKMINTAHMCYQSQIFDSDIYFWIYKHTACILTDFGAHGCKCNSVKSALMDKG